MKKYSCFLLLLFLILMLDGCYYKELTDNESIVLANNEARSVIFLLNEYGYGESNRFITKVNDGDKITIREGKLYKGELNFKTIIDDSNYILNNYIDNIVFYTNTHGLQGATYDEELISDASYNYLQNGYNELIINYGNTNHFISLFDNSDNRIIPETKNKNILFAGSFIDSKTSNKITNVYKSSVFLYSINDKIYLKKNAQNKIFNDITGEESIENINFNNEIATINNIKKAVIIDNLDTSITIIQCCNNIIYVVDNTTFEVKEIRKFTNISTIDRLDNYFYIIENNIIYIYNDKFREIEKVKFDSKIIGSAWYKEVDISYLKLALLSDDNHIILDRVDIVK